MGYFEYRRIHGVSPSERILRVLTRLSKNRIIFANEANQIAWKASQMWSGNPDHTYRAVQLTANSYQRNPRWEFGKIKFSYPDEPDFGDWYRCEDQARAKKRQFCLIENHHKKVRRVLFQKEFEALQIKTFINRIKKEMTNHVKDAQFVR
jgi:hypothetical protein